jgi:hypothetical protein
MTLLIVRCAVMQLKQYDRALEIFKQGINLNVTDATFTKEFKKVLLNSDDFSYYCRKLVHVNLRENSPLNLHLQSRNQLQLTMNPFQMKQKSTSEAPWRSQKKLKNKRILKYG